MIEAELLEAALWCMLAIQLFDEDVALREEFPCVMDLVAFMQYASGRLILSAARSEN